MRTHRRGSARGHPRDRQPSHRPLGRSCPEQWDRHRYRPHRRGSRTEEEAHRGPAKAGRNSHGVPRVVVQLHNKPLLAQGFPRRARVSHRRSLTPSNLGKSWSSGRNTVHKSLGSDSEESADVSAHTCLLPFHGRFSTSALGQQRANRTPPLRHSQALANPPG